MDTVEALEKVKEEVAGGWTKGNFICRKPEHPRGYTVCMMGAVFSTFGVHGRFSSNTYVLERQLKIESILQQIVEENTNFKSITAFNDAENTTKEDVLKMIDLAIEKEKSCQTAAA